MKLLKAIFLLTIFSTITFAQAVVMTPEFATENDSISIVFDAAQASRDDLVGYTGDLYVHTGVNTTAGDWQHVIGDWGSTNQPKLTKIGTDLYQLDIGYPREFYSVTNAGELIKTLNFVFRSANGSLQTEDIIIDLFGYGVNVKIIEPSADLSFKELNDNVSIAAISQNATFVQLYINGILKTSSSDDTLKYSFQTSETGKTTIIAKAVNTSQNESSADTAYFYTNPSVTLQDAPQGIQPGINYLNDNSLILCLEAPNKNFVYALGDFSDWDFQTEFFMNKSTDGELWWIQIDNLIAQKEYIYQYMVDGTIRIADPYSDKISDPWNDQYISNNTYPALIQYPSGKTSEIASVFQTAQTNYNWEVTDFTKPANDKLVIYELLMRDFLAAHDYKTLIDTLDYIQNLGINAIELMPVNEFEGNLSWGYNPIFYFALDKYYGPKDTFKKFVDEAHKRGIAVIMDMVLNHAYGGCPLIRLYADGNYGPPSSDNPWFNTTSPNPVYSWGSDFNHQSPYTQRFVDRVNSYWIEEYKIDGFRFDFSKGFTNTAGDGWSYDSQRISILKRMADHIWNVNPDTYVILEHFTDNSEEKVLADYGMMLWGNMNSAYNEATMGYNDGGKSNISWGLYTSRGWSKPNLVSYMESHDEERIMFKNLEYGNSSGSYSVKDLNVALQRVKMAAAFFITVPGPKMMQMFQELGYDISLEDPCRVCEKPILWNYFDVVTRKNLYKTFTAINKLKADYPAFSTADFSLADAGSVKRLQLNHSSMDVNIIGNFDVTAKNMSPSFQNTGWWYDYFTGDSINVTNTTDTYYLEPGEFHIYTTVKLPTPEDGIAVGIEDNETSNSSEVTSYNLGQNYPNPFNPATIISYQLPQSGFVSLKVYDILGRKVAELVSENQMAGYHSVDFNASNLTSGVYIYRLNVNDFSQTRKMILLR